MVWVLGLIVVLLSCILLQCCVENHGVWDLATHCQEVKVSCGGVDDCVLIIHHIVCCRDARMCTLGRTFHGDKTRSVVCICA